MTESERIARAIIANCDDFNAGRKTHGDWDAEQLRLWQRAERRHCNWAVARLVAPAPDGSLALDRSPNL